MPFVEEITSAEQFDKYVRDPGEGYRSVVVFYHSDSCNLNVFILFFN
jgi:hypothetical protein